MNTHTNLLLIVIAAMLAWWTVPHVYQHAQHFYQMDQDYMARTATAKRADDARWCPGCTVK